MNIRNLNIESIGHLAAHTIVAKTPTQDARAHLREILITGTKEEKEMLAERMSSALKNLSKTFQLEFEETGEDSIHGTLSGAALDDAAFLEYSKKLARKLASSHFRVNIPGGHCLIGEGVATRNVKFFFVIKAELQQVFNIESNELRLIKDVFLSPAKELYKIGIFFIETSGITPFMYDDQFSLQKKDLTEYFYSNFLGLTTDKNDRLRSKNFYEQTKNFAERNIDNVADRIGIVKALDVLYREDATGIISPETFSETYFEGELKAKFDEMIGKDFPIAFTKDISLVENRSGLQRMSIPLSYQMDIVGDAASLERVEVIDNPSENELQRVGVEINNGNLRKLIMLKEAATPQPVA